ncbi:MAG: sodium:solute symporter family transporter [Limisphaerales bacterium]
MHELDYAVIIAYLGMTLGLGFWFGRKQSRKEFFAAGGSMGWLAVGLSVMATLFSSNSFVFYPSAAFGGTVLIGLSLVTFTLMTPLIVYVFIPMFRRLECETAYHYLEKRFHVSVRCLASGLFILLRIAWMASATYAASLVVATVAGVPQVAVIILLGVVAIAYTIIGGLRAVMWTDVIQFFVFALTIGIALVLLVMKSGLGPGEMATHYFSDRDGVWIDFELSMTLKYGSWAILIGVFLEALSAFGADQVAVQRYIAASSEKTAQRGAWINLLGMWIVIPGLLMIGIGLYGHFDQHPQELETLLKSVEAGASIPDQVRADNLSDNAMPQFVKLHFPPGMIGLFLAALMAAIMSSIDSGIHSVTTALVVDFRDRLFPHLKPEDDRRDVFLIRMLVMLIGGISVGLACFVGNLGDVFAIGKKMTAGFGGPLLAVFILAFFVPRAGTRGVFVGALAGAGITIFLMYAKSEWFSVWFWPIGFGISIVFGILLGGGRSEEPLTYRGVMKR